jgi:hypothetical protein
VLAPPTVAASTAAPIRSISTVNMAASSAFGTLPGLSSVPPVISVTGPVPPAVAAPALTLGLTASWESWEPDTPSRKAEIGKPKTSTEVVVDKGKGRATEDAPMQVRATPVPKRRRRSTVVGKSKEPAYEVEAM